MALSVFPDSLCAQQKPESDLRFKLAQSYERSGDYESALKIYEELYPRDSTNLVLFESLKRVYLLTKRDEDAIRLMERRLRVTPNDPGLLAQLGSVLLRNSKESKAVEAWEKAVSVQPQSEVTYRVVASAMIESRAFEKAIAMYQRGREACRNPSLFISDLAYLYGIMLSYGEATKEYLRMLRDNPAQLSYVQSRLSAYSGRMDALEAMISAVEEASNNEPSNVTFLYLLSWLNLEGKNHDKAFDIVRRIDAMTRAGGKEIFNFAERSLKEKALQPASRAYDVIIREYTSFPHLAQAKFGYARAMEELHAPKDTLSLVMVGSTPTAESEPGILAVIAAYRRVVTEYPGSELAARSLLRIATLRYERYFDLDAAFADLAILTAQYNNVVTVVLEGKILLAELLAASNKLDEAEKLYRELSGTRYLSVDQQQTITFRSALLLYWREDFTASLATLAPLSKQVTLNVANDAIDLQIFIQENLKENESLLKIFARADLLVKQRKLSEALSMFQEIASSTGSSALHEHSCLRSGDILTVMKRFNEAFEFYELIQKKFPDSIVLDKALIKQAYLYETGLQQRDKAVSVYQKLLEMYPQSLYANEARKRIRLLRGDSL